MKTVYTKPKKVKDNPWEAGTVIRRMILSWLTAVTAEYLLLAREEKDLAELSGIAAMAPLRVMLLTGAVFCLLFVLRRYLKAATERWAMAAVFAALAVASLAASFTWALLAACGLILSVLVVYALKGWNGTGGPAPCPEKEKGALLTTAVATVLFFLFVSIWTVCRIRSFVAPTFDFGIFSQMFHSMKTTGLPITTVERDGPLSHFAVHVSPIYYLLLPFYCLVPKPETLQVLQAAVLASAVIPLWLIGKEKGLSPYIRAALCGVLLLYPAYAGGASYDIHENAFLTPLILWLFYGIDRKNNWLTGIFGALTLMVKEDAAVYVAVIALYLLLRSVLRRDRWGKFAGALLLAGSVVYFAAVTGYLANSGDGVMTYRYKNFMYDGSSSLVTVIKAVLLCPMKAVFESVDKEKMQFIGLTMGVLVFLPVMTRRFERLILLIPYVLVNLMSDYQYQHDIFFQYTYGATGCLFYLMAANLGDFSLDRKRMGALVLALALSAGCFGNQVFPKAMQYPRDCKTYASYYDKIRQVLDTVPEDVSVAASTFYTTYLSQRQELYDIRYASQEHVFQCEYLVLSVTDQNSYKKYTTQTQTGYEALTALMEEQGYEKIAEYEGRLEIYHRP